MLDKNNIITTLRISGDSGDGIQVIGNILAKSIAIVGNNISTTPDYPSEIRAPIGTLEGVSTFEISFGDEAIIPPSNKADIIVIMNPAALKLNEGYIKKNSTIIVNSGTFSEENLEKVGYKENPLLSGKYGENAIISINLIEEVKNCLSHVEIPEIQKIKSKNFYLLGLIAKYLNLREEEPIKLIKNKFISNSLFAKMNILAFESGFKKGIIGNNCIIKHGTNNNLQKYKILSGNEIIAYSLITSAKSANKKLYFSGYPITPASNIMHTLAKYRQDDIIVIQAEDEIAAIGGAIGGSYAGAIGVTATSGPGFSLKSEVLNLAVIAELPLLVIDVQRGGPSTGLPTKTEQSDLLQALFGRHGESPIVVMAISSNGESFQIVQDAIKIAVKYMTPVVLLSDSYLAHNSCVFQIPNIDEVLKIQVPELPNAEIFHPYLRNNETLARPWATPGIKGYEHRIGGLEKNNETGNISYNGDNHELMTGLRAEKIMKVQNDIPETIINGKKTGDLLIIGWGSTYSSIITATNKAINEGLQVSSINLIFINPLPRDLEEIIKGFKKILIVEENSGQLSFVLEGKLGIKTEKLNKIKGQKIFPEEIYNRIKELI